MREKQVRQKLYKMLRLLGYWPITSSNTSVCIKCHAQMRPPIGRPDIICLHPLAPSIVVEVKTLGPNETSFPLSRITPEQRQWLDRWQEADGLGYIGLGVIRPAGMRTKLEHLYLVPWFIWQSIEGLVGQYQESIPLVAGKGFRREMQVHHLDIVTLLLAWELYSTEGTWHLPPGHRALPQKEQPIERESTDTTRSRPAGCSHSQLAVG